MCHGGSRRGGLARSARRFRAGARGIVRRSSSCKWRPPVVRLLVWRMDSKASCSSSSGCAGPLGVRPSLHSVHRQRSSYASRRRVPGSSTPEPHTASRAPRWRRRSIRSGRRRLLPAPRCVRAWIAPREVLGESPPPGAGGPVPPGSGRCLSIDPRPWQRVAGGKKPVLPAR